MKSNFLYVFGFALLLFLNLQVVPQLISSGNSFLFFTGAGILLAQIALSVDFLCRNLFSKKELQK